MAAPGSDADLAACAASLLLMPGQSPRLTSTDVGHPCMPKLPNFGLKILFNMGQNSSRPQLEHPARGRPTSSAAPEIRLGWEDEISQVFPWLYIGSHHAAENLALMRKLDVRCFINCTTRQMPGYLSQERDLTCLSVPVNDDPKEQIAPHFERAAQWARSKDGSTLLVFCMAGISRSATIVLVLLMKNRGMSLAAGFQQLRQVRPKVRPNKGFIGQLLHFELKLRGSNSMRRSGNTLVPLDLPQRMPVTPVGIRRGGGNGGGGGGSPADNLRSAPSEVPDSIPDGTAVACRHDLPSERVSHAGKQGVVIGQPSTRVGGTGAEYVVQLAVDGTFEQFGHAELLQRVAVTLIALESRSELNGRVGTVEGWDSSRGRYEVRMAAGVPWVKVRPYNVILPQGSRATITGLARYNGRIGAVVSHDAADGRYSVQLSDAHELRVRRENVTL